MSQKYELAPRIGLEKYDRWTLPGKYKKMITSFRQLSTDVRHYASGAPNYSKQEKYLSPVEAMDTFIVFTGEEQPSLTNPAYRELITEILSPETTLADFNTPQVKSGASTAEYEAASKHLRPRLWEAIVSILPEEERHTLAGSTMGTLILHSDAFYRIIDQFLNSRNSDHKGWMSSGDEYAKLFKKYLASGELSPEDIFYSLSSVSAWNSKESTTHFGTYFSDPEPIMRLKSGEFSFHQMIYIMRTLHDLGENYPEMKTQMFQQGSHATKVDVMEQLWEATKVRLDILHLTEFTDLTLLTMSDMVINADTGMTLLQAVAKAQEIVAEAEEDVVPFERKSFDNKYDTKALSLIRETIAGWDNFVLEVDVDRITKLAASTNPVVREGASTSLMLSAAISGGEAWKAEASIANAQLGSFSKDADDDLQPQEGTELSDEKLLEIFLENNIVKKRDLLEKKSLKKVIAKLSKKYEDLLPAAFQSAVKSGIKISTEILNEVGIDVSPSFFEEISENPAALTLVVKQLKILMVKFHPDRQIAKADLYENPEMKQLADDGHAVLKDLYEWYETVSKNYHLISKK